MVTEGLMHTGVIHRRDTTFNGGVIEKFFPVKLLYGSVGSIM